MLSPSIEHEHRWARLPQGPWVERMTLLNGQGAWASFISLGASLQSLHIPDGQGKVRNVVLGYEHLSDYLQATSYLGAVIGRVANRMANSRLSLGDESYTLSANHGRHSLHGGQQGFSHRLWSAASQLTEQGPSVVFTLLSADGDQGYPGNVHVSVRYTLSAEPGLHIDYHAITDRLTALNLTHHAYFNLSAGESPSVAHHQLQVKADCITAVDDQCIATGAFQDIRHTALDFRQASALGPRWQSSDPLIRAVGGLDHNFVLAESHGQVQQVAQVSEPLSKLTMIVATSQPGLQLYGGHGLADPMVGLHGRAYGPGSGFCLEAQHFPNSPQHTHFPSISLAPGQAYRHQACYVFQKSP